MNKVNKQKASRFTTVNVPTILIEEIDELLKEKSFLYTTRADFITEAIRLKVQEWKREIKEEKFPRRRK